MTKEDETFLKSRERISGILERILRNATKTKLSLK
jgi:hypothetical protein